MWGPLHCHFAQALPLQVLPGFHCFAHRFIMMFVGKGVSSRKVACFRVVFHVELNCKGSLLSRCSTLSRSFALKDGLSLKNEANVTQNSSRSYANRSIYKRTFLEML